MKYRKVSIPIAVLIVAALTFSCSDDPTGPERTGVGALEVWLNVTGDAADPDGFTVSLDDALQKPVPAGQTVQFAEVAAGSHTVSLGSVETYCTVSGDNPRTVTITPSEVAATQFDVACGSSELDSYLAGMEILGSGYDLTGNYADVADVKAQVLDLAALDKAGLLRQVQYERSTFDVVAGKTSTQYTSNLSVSVGIEGGAWGFSGAVKNSFSESRYTSAAYSFATVRSLIRKHGLRVVLYATSDMLRDYLTEAARSAINEWPLDTDDLFDTYGLVVLTGIIVGGRLDYNTSANMSFERSGRGIGVYARVGFSNLFASASIETQVVSEESFSTFAASEQRHLEVYGGRSEYGQYIINEGVYESWIESIDENPVFCDFERTGLTLLYELADDEARRQELKAAWKDYADRYGISLAGLGPVVSNFEEGIEGWGFYEGGKYGFPTPRLVNGYFGRYISAKEITGGYGLNFIAAPKFYGDKSTYDQGSLEYYLWYVETPPVTFGTVPLVQIMSENGNLTYWPVEPGPDEYHHPPLDGSPRRYVVPLLEGWQSGDDIVTGRWVRWDLEKATQNEIFRSLANVTAIWIQGEFGLGEEHVALDKVSLNMSDSN